MHARAPMKALVGVLAAACVALGVVAAATLDVLL